MLDTDFRHFDSPCGKRNACEIETARKYIVAFLA
jgi:hypothetical protein